MLTNTLQNAVHLHSILNYGNYQFPSLIKNFINTKISNSSIKKESYDLIIKALVDVVNDPKGTAYKLSFNDKNFMGGKTGTAQVFSIKEEDREEGDYKNENLSQNLMDHSLFVGFAPIDKPKYIVSLTVEHGGSGSSVAAPLSKKILKQAVALNV